MAAATTFAAIASAVSIASGVKGLVGGKPKAASSNNVAAKDLAAQQEEDKRKLARQKEQRKPTETFLTGGQGLATGEYLG